MKNRKTVLMMIIVALAIGFATVSTTLAINGLIGIGANKDDFKVIFTSAKLNNVIRNDFIDETKTIINFETNILRTKDEEAILDFEITNTSKQYDAEVVINCVVPENEYVIVDYQPKSMQIPAGEAKKGRLVVRLIKPIDIDHSIKITTTFTSSAKERLNMVNLDEEKFKNAGVLYGIGYSDQRLF